ncbi:MAG TPA: aspartyl protease family protein, partial [Clostridia bacterium]|nr:aspartyl protease family protein [Clostridia bacterium]
MNELTWKYSVGWSAVWISTVITCFWAFWGINENFHEGWYYSSLLQNLGLMVIQFLSPMLLFMGITLVAVFWPKIGACLHLALGIFLGLFFFRPLTSTIALFIMGPMVVLALLYWYGKPHSRQLAVCVLILFPLLTLIICGVSPALRVATRLDDGNRGARQIEGNGVCLIWAPSGPGWPDRGTFNWEEANRRCQYLTEDGTALASTPQNIWRLPTADEAARSMSRHGRNSGGSWSPSTGQASYRNQPPDKETPLWNPRSPIIYWWTATEKDARLAYIAVYDGRVWPRSKQVRMGDLAFRAVKNAPVITAQEDELNAAAVLGSHSENTGNTSNRPLASTTTVASNGTFRGISIPFDFDPLLQPKIAIATRVNGSRPLPCFFDTGLNLPLLLSAPTAEELGLATGTDTVLIEPGSLTCRKVSVQNLLLGQGVEIQLKTGFVAPPGAEGKVWDSQFAGVLGVPLFAEKCCVQLDFNSRQMRVFSSTNKAPSIEGSSEVPLRHAGKLRYVVPVSFGNAGPVELLLDTGAADTRLPASLKPALEGLPKSQRFGHSRDGTPEVVETFLLPELKIGALTVSSVAVEIASSNTTPVLGLELLSRFRVTLNFPNERMLLEATSGMEQNAQIKGESGVRILQAGSSFRVLEVLPDSAALEAGLLAGDEILSVGGRSLGGLNLWQAHRLVNGFEARTVEVAVTRLGHTRHLKLTPQTLFSRRGTPSNESPPEKGRLGMELSPGPG